MVVDTSILIDFLRAKDKSKTIYFNASKKQQFCISTITIYELLMGATNEEKKKDIEYLTEDLIVLPFSKEIAETAAEIFHKLKKTNKIIEFRDIFIAATCIVTKKELLTLNKKHFKRISGLKLH